MYVLKYIRDYTALVRRHMYCTSRFRRDNKTCIPVFRGVNYFCTVLAKTEKDLEFFVNSAISSFHWKNFGVFEVLKRVQTDDKSDFKTRSAGTQTRLKLGRRCRFMYREEHSQTTSDNDVQHSNLTLRDQVDCSQSQNNAVQAR